MAQNAPHPKEGETIFTDGWMLDMPLPDIPSNNKYRVQIAEDDGTIAQLIVMNLQTAGFATFVSPDGAQALQDFERISPHLLLCDIIMPGMTGHELIARVRAQSPIPIIMLTANDTDEVQLRGFKEGADDYISKPFNPKLLIARVIANLRRAYRYNPDMTTTAVASPTSVTTPAPVTTPEPGLPKGFLRCGECPYIGPSWKFNALDSNKRPIVQCPSCGNRAITFNIG